LDWWNKMKWNGKKCNWIILHCLDLKNNNGIKYNMMEWISSQTTLLPSILLLSFLNYPNNKIEYYILSIQQSLNIYGQIAYTMVLAYLKYVAISSFGKTIIF
jgi:hypothetical protein